ncbi:MAG TPA: AraC family transcriptional regulator [Hanamia sp.]|nr:AraC family transcriptional regulator [Hanamia sp.]
MKLFQTEISPGINSYLSLIERDDAFFKAPYHFHPEMELVYVIESFGKRIIGDAIESFAEGDMVFIGSNLPHIWMNDEIFYKENSRMKAKAIVLYFNKNIFSQGFYNMKETLTLNSFFQNAEKGILITGKTKEVVAQKLKNLFQKKDFERIIGFFEIMDILSQSNDISFITSDGYNAQLNHSETDRLWEVYNHIQQNFKENISLSTIANISNLTPQSFCRMFKKRTGKSFVEYLNEARISAACKYLLDTDWSISEIAYNCGYKTVSNFNKLFKSITGSSPKVYRAQIKTRP